MSWFSEFMGSLFGKSKAKAKKAKAAKPAPDKVIWTPAPAPAAKGPLYVNYDLHPDVSQFPHFGLNIVDWKAQFTRPANSGKVYVYYAIGEIGKSEPYFNDPAIPTMGINPDWGSKYVDVRSPAWADFLIGMLRKSYATGQFDGTFFDTGDTYWALDAKLPGHLAEFVKSTAEIINRVKAAFPGKGIIPNRSFNAWPYCADSCTAFLFEGLFQDNGEKRPSYTQELLELAAPIKASGKPVYVIDYVYETQIALARETAARIRAAGFLPFVTTGDCDGKILAS